MKLATFKTIALLFAVNFWLSSLHAQLSLDISGGLAINKTQFAERFNNNSGYHNSYIYPTYHKNLEHPYTYSPMLNLALTTEKNKTLNMRYGISTGIYSEAINYNDMDIIYGSSQYTKTVVYGNGCLKQPYIRLELTPIVKIKQFSVLLGLINVEHLFKAFDSKIEGTKNVDLHIPYKIQAPVSGGPTNAIDSIVTSINSEAISYSTPMIADQEDYRSTFFPIYLGLEYELNSSKSSIVFGTKALLSYSEKYAATPHSSIMIYVSYRFRVKKIINPSVKILKS